VIEGALSLEVAGMERRDEADIGLFVLTEPAGRGAGGVALGGTGLAAGDAEGRGLPPASSQLSAATPSPDDAQELFPR
jgi:hypothetical protein